MNTNDPEQTNDFYLELHQQSDYLNDIEIQDEYEKISDNSRAGLSDEQVSQIALDSLAAAELSEAKQRSADQLPSN